MTDVKTLFQNALEISKKSGPRSGTFQGFAFIWIDLYGKDPATKAFRRYAKKTGKVFDNYRGAAHAWYFGSQSDVGKYDALCDAAKYLSDNGIQCGVGDAWD